MEGGEAGLSCPWMVPFSFAVASTVGDVAGRLGDTGVCDLDGLSGEGVGLGVPGAGLLMDDADDDVGVDEQAAGRAGNEDCILRPSRASSSLHTAKLRLPGSRPPISEHLALS